MGDLAIPTGFNALSEAQKTDHRAKIGVRSQAILGNFWRDDEPDAVRAIELEGWMDVLENCSHSEIRKAWATYQRTGPRTASGKLYKPDAGALYLLIAKSRPKPELVKPANPLLERTHEEPTEEQKERMAEYVRQAGFAPKKIPQREYD